MRVYFSIPWLRRSLRIDLTKPENESQGYLFEIWDRRALVMAEYRWGSDLLASAIPVDHPRVIDCFHSLLRGGRTGEYP